MKLPESIPLFPLNTVLFPGGTLPLRIFESRYLDMVADCLRNDTGFGVCLISRGKEVGQAADFFKIGTYARIIQWEQHQDGILGVNVRGDACFRVTKFTVNKKNQLVEGEVLWLENQKSITVPPEFSRFKVMFLELSIQLRLPDTQEQYRLDDADWLGYRLAEILPLTLAEKQNLLEIEASIKRLERIRVLVTATPC